MYSVYLTCKTLVSTQHMEKAGKTNKSNDNQSLSHLATDAQDPHTSGNTYYDCFTCISEFVLNNYTGNFKTLSIFLPLPISLFNLFLGEFNGGLH